MKFIPLLMLLTYLLQGIACSSRQAKEEQAPLLTLEEFRALDWEKRANYLLSFPERSAQEYRVQFISAGLTDAHTHVIKSALQAVINSGNVIFRDQVLKLLKHPDPIVRWRALLVTESMFVTNDIFPDIGRLCDDNEWLVRETAFRMVRLFTEEKNQKKLYFSILFKLNEKNLSVLKEMYKTLIWYDDERTFSFIYKRSFVAKNSAEIVTIFRELAPLRRNEVRIRLRILAKSKNAVVKQEASRLLAEYY